MTTIVDESAIPEYQKLLRLDDRNYIVLGGGLGIGRQTCHALRQAGAKVFCVDNDPRRAAKVAAEVGGISHATDCTRRDDVEELVIAAEQQMGRVDGFVDIIGMSQLAGVLDVDDRMWDRQFDINLRHAFLISQVAGRCMRDTGGGTMVFIASVSGLRSAPGYCAYGASKAALMSLIQSLAIELAPFRIRANGVAPGSITTPRLSGPGYEVRAERMRSVIPLGVRGEPSDVAAAALFLSSPLSGYVTGQTLVVDGGVMTAYPFAP